MKDFIVQNYTRLFILDEKWGIGSKQGDLSGNEYRDSWISACEEAFATFMIQSKLTLDLCFSIGSHFCISARREGESWIELCGVYGD
jgi:hypothetical protein